MSTVQQKRPFYSGNLNSKIPGNENPLFYIEETLQVLQSHMKLMPLLLRLVPIAADLPTSRTSCSELS